MIAVDTNVLVRFLVRDDEVQAARAATLIQANENWVSRTVLCGRVAPVDFVLARGAGSSRTATHFAAQSECGSKGCHSRGGES